MLFAAASIAPLITSGNTPHAVGYECAKVSAAVAVGGSLFYHLSWYCDSVDIVPNHREEILQVCCYGRGLGNAYAMPKLLRVAET